MKKTQKEIIWDVNYYEEYFTEKVKESRKKYYLCETDTIKKDMIFHDFLDYRGKLMLILDILGKYESMKDKYRIIVY